MSTQPPVSPGGIRILVIDDEPHIRRMIQWALEEEGFVVDTAADGQDGLARAIGSPPALIVLDMYLPAIDGVGVAERLREAQREPPPVILITADDRPADLARRVGAFAYLRKPFDLDDLLAAVRQGLNASPI